MTIDRSAAGFTVVEAPAELLPGTRSAASDVTLAWLVRSPAASGVTEISTPAPCPLAIVPSAHVTVPLDSAHVPWDGVADPNVTPAGSVSVTVTPVALDGPALATLKL